MKFNHAIKRAISTALTVSVLVACSGGGGDATAPGETTTGGTEGGTTTTTTDGSTITPVTTTCTPAPALPSQYSRVFKGCDSAGVAQYYDITECVRDNTTGLIWQGQTPAGSGLRANDQDKTNFDSTTVPQKYDASVAGSYRAPTLSEINASTNSVGFMNAVNGTNLCGFSNWRIPTKDELLSLVKSSESPKIDNAWFINTPAVTWYWTSTSLGTAMAWGIQFSTGTASYGGRVGVAHTGVNLVRLVH